MNAPGIDGPHEQPLAGRNTQRATMQTPQGVDAKHSDKLFLVERQYI
jgi:hypothetical protein